MPDDVAVVGGGWLEKVSRLQQEGELFLVNSTTRSWQLRDGKPPLNSIQPPRYPLNRYLSPRMVYTLICCCTGIIFDHEMLVRPSGCQFDLNLSSWTLISIGRSKSRSIGGTIELLPHLQLGSHNL